LLVDGKLLRVGVKNAEVTVPAPSSDAPDLVLSASAGTLSALFAGVLDVDAAVTSGRTEITGDITEARRFFTMFRFPAPSSSETGATSRA
jgi:putative sterol carrier protein